MLKLPLAKLQEQAKDQLNKAGFEKIDYIEVCDAFSLEPATETNKDQKLVVLTAAFIEGVRLIDNLLLS